MGLGVFLVAETGGFDVGTVLLLAVLGGLVLAGAGMGFGRGRVPTGFQLLIESGVLFVFLGVLFGPHAFGLVSLEVVRDLEPVLMIALGWIGFLYGSNLEFRRMRKFPAALYGLALGQGTLTLLAVAGVAYGLLAMAPATWWDGAVDARSLAAIALVLGSAAAGTSPAALFVLGARRTGKREDVAALQFVATLDDLPGLLGLGVAFAFLNPKLADLGWFAGLAAFAGMIALGVLAGYVLELLYPRGRVDERTSAMIFLAIICTASGCAQFLQLSPLFVGVVLGVTFANITHLKESAYAFLQGREKDHYVVLLILSGILWHPSWWWLTTAVPLYVIVRALAKVGAFWACNRVLGDSPGQGGLGLSLLSQGGTGLAVAISYELAFEPGRHLVATTVVFAVILNQVFGTSLASWQLARRKRQ